MYDCLPHRDTRSLLIALARHMYVGSVHYNIIGRKHLENGGRGGAGEDRRGPGGQDGLLTIYTPPVQSSREGRLLHSLALLVLLATVQAPTEA
jgi:hypothetical protein